MSYAQFLKEECIYPASMTHTHVYSKAVYDKIPVDVVGHDRGQWRYSVAQNFLDGPVGDKGIYSTVADLFLYDARPACRQVIKQATLDSAYVPRNRCCTAILAMVYGWRTFTAPGQEVITYRLVARFQAYLFARHEKRYHHCIVN